MFNSLSRVICFVLAATLPGLAPAQEVDKLRVYVWGNSLIDHPTESDGTAVPYWLNLLAAADGRDLALSGEYTFGIEFPDKIPPSPTWTFPGVTPSYTAEQGSFAAADIDTVLINPENFIQYQAPDAVYEGNIPDQRSAISGTVELAKWAMQDGARPTVFLYEGWAEMKRFPPLWWQYRRYQAFTTGDYHDWYLDYHAGVAAAVPELDVRLIPVGSILTGLLTEGPLQELTPVDLYTDDAPHGTPTTYLIAALITYSALYNAPPPADFSRFEDAHPLLVANYAATAEFIWRHLADFTAPRQRAENTEVERGSHTPLKQAEAPVPIPAANTTGLENPSLGMGLNGIADWSTQQPFVDVMKTARRWVGHTQSTWGAWSYEDLLADGVFDDQGWVTRLPDGVDRIETFVLTELPQEVQSLRGSYRMTWKGSGTLDVVGLAKVQARNDHEIWFNFRPDDDTVAVQIRETDPEGTGDYIRDIAIVHENHIPLHEVGMVFNPDFVARIADLRSLRFMDWMFTNGSDKVTWQDRARVSDYSYAQRGVPVEHLLTLANLVGADPWIPMPHMADDDFIRRYAETVRDGLDLRLKVYVEYSNELWNRIFPQAIWAGQQAEARWGDAAGDNGWMQFAGMRAAEVADLWTDVFGDDAPARLVNVIAVQTGWPGLEEPLLQAPLWQAEGHEAPVTRFQAYAVSGYFGHSIGSEDGGGQLRSLLDEAAETARAAGAAQGLQRVALREYVREHRFQGTIAPTIARLREGSLAELTEELWPYHAGVAAKHGLALVMYEGGTHIQGQGPWLEDADMTAYFHQLNYTPDMAEIYTDLLQAWRAVGGTMFNAFVDVGAPSKYGSWGHLRHLDDSNPRWDALMAFDRDTPAWWEVRTAETFRNGVMSRGTDGADRIEGSSEEDVLIGLGGDDVLIAHGRGDFLHGGAGNDVAVLPGAYGDYGFDMAGDVLRIWRGAQVSHLRDIETVRFADIEIGADLLQAQ
ncbi:calcium-binding protein [Phaeobacter sp. J2-8]|uniref:calcium-binding protein n=1 Tax=Phaeobacter sp. J2-8 TaxID=2931394 RepID=UPI001FCF8B70|nr:calcium-binding protein [Phaeobacter sp. J2-8]MCJ7874265.1 calcium-binding protein [Phaeobacter sp. J2-8]